MTGQSNASAYPSEAFLLTLLIQRARVLGFPSSHDVPHSRPRKFIMGALPRRARGGLMRSALFEASALDRAPSPRPAPARVRAAAGTIAICGGGTAGHVMTGLAIAEELRRRDGPEALFLGGRHGLESTLVPGGPCDFLALPCAPVARERAAAGLLGALSSVTGALQARRALRERGAVAAIGVGGYASVPGVLAAWSLGLPVSIVEVNSHPGLANRALARLADRVFLGELSDAAGYAPHAVRVTGVPLRQAFGHLRDRRPVRGPLRVLVTGGSLGSAFLNGAVPELLARVRAAGVELAVTHQTGPADVLAVRRAYRAADVPADVCGFLGDFAAELARADFVIGSPGAVTIAELAATGVPCLLVPDPRAAADHQAANAAAFAARTGCLSCRPADWDAAQLADALVQRFSDPARLAGDARRVAGSAAPGAAARLVDECLRLIETR